MSMAHSIAAVMADHDRGPEYALVQCIGEGFTCPAEERVERSAALSDEQIVDILADRGWSVGPTLCPEHRPPTRLEAAWREFRTVLPANVPTTTGRSIFEAGWHAALAHDPEGQES